MIMRFDFERAAPAVADIDDAGILARTLEYQLTARRQSLQMHARRLVGAMLGPHDGGDAEVGPRRLASGKQFFNFFVFVRSKAVLPDHPRSNGWDRRGGHHGEVLLSHFWESFW